MYKLLLIVYIGFFLNKGFFQIHAISPSACSFTKEQPKISATLRIQRFTERILPFFLMDPILQIRFYTRRSELHGQLAKAVIKTNPSLGYQELLRSINALTLLEKPIRSIGTNHNIYYEDIWKSISDIKLLLKEYQYSYKNTCSTELDSLSDFLMRDEKTLKKIYYESLLIPTKEDYSGK